MAREDRQTEGAAAASLALSDGSPWQAELLIRPRAPPAIAWKAKADNPAPGGASPALLLTGFDAPSTSVISTAQHGGHTATDGFVPVENHCDVVNFFELAPI